jgi:hypothetical protein
MQWTKEKGWKNKQWSTKHHTEKMKGMNAGATERWALPASLVVSVVLVITASALYSYIANDNT